MYFVFNLLVLVLSYNNYVDSANILIIYPIPGGSHYNLGSGVARILVEAGHDVTLISPFENKNPPKIGGKWTDVVLTGFSEDREKIFQNKSFFDRGNMPVIMNIPLMNGIGEDMVRRTYEHPNVQTLIKSNAKFDAVIIEQFNNDALKGFAFYYKAPLILVSSLPANGWVNGLVGNPGPSSYIPEVFVSYSSHMTFCERVKNTIFAIAMELNRNLYFFPKQNEILHEYLPNAPHLDELLYNASLIFINSHVSINQPRPHVPAMIEIGGFHITPPKVLPKDLKNYLDNANEGVIYFSMGSVMKSVTMSEERKNMLVKAFSKLKHKVLWKWEEDVLPGQPKNVKTGKWLPQSDILAHKNVKLFITHGGLLSTTEAIYHGKPTLVFPIFGDQRMNAAAVVHNGIALSLNFFSVGEDELVTTINELMNNPKYFQNAQTRSRIFLDRPISPQKSVVYWVEYVIRHRGTSHLRVAALDLAWYQYLLLDVFAFLIGTSLLVLLGSVFAVKRICKSKRKQKGKEQKLKKK